MNNLKQIKQIFALRLVKDFSSIILLQFFSKIVALGANIWIVRCLSPEKLGISGIAFAISGPFVLLTTQRLEVYLTRNYAKYREQSTENKVIFGIFAFQLVNSLALLGLIGIGLALIGFPTELSIAIFAGGLMYLLTATQPNWALLAQERTKEVYKGNSIISLINGLLAFAFFKPNMAVGSDLVIYSISMLGSYAYIWWRVLNRSDQKFKIDFSFYPQAWQMCLENRWLFLIASMQLVQHNINIPMLAWLHSVEEVGYYRPVKILELNILSLTGALSWLLIPRFVRWYREKGENTLWDRQRTLILITLIASFLAGAISFIASPHLFKLLFGPEYTSSATAFTWVLMAVLIQFASGIFNSGFLARGEDFTAFKLFGGLMAFSLIAYYLFIPSHGMTGLALVYFVSELITFFVITWVAHKRHLQLISQENEKNSLD